MYACTVLHDPYSRRVPALGVPQLLVTTLVIMWLAQTLPYYRPSPFEPRSSDEGRARRLLTLGDHPLSEARPVNTPRTTTAKLLAAFLAAVEAAPEGSEATEATAAALEAHLLVQGDGDGAVTFEVYPAGDNHPDLVAVILIRVR